jgi:hypothetical protein
MSKIIITAIKAELAEARKQVSALEAALAALTDGAANAAQPKPGDRMADGTVYVGVSPTSERPLYAMPHDLEGLYTWAGATTAAAAQTFGGHTDWRVPTLEELNMLYRAREAVGGFQRDWYWSSSETYSSDARVQNFSNGVQGVNSKSGSSRVRCVRSG